MTTSKPTWRRTTCELCGKPMLIGYPGKVRPEWLKQCYRHERPKKYVSKQDNEEMTDEDDQ